MLECVSLEAPVPSRILMGFLEEIALELSKVVHWSLRVQLLSVSTEQ